MQGKQIGGHGSGQAGSDGGVDEDGSDGEKGHNRPCLFIRLCGCELGVHLVPPLLAQDRLEEQAQSRVKELGNQGLEALSLAFSPS